MKLTNKAYDLLKWISTVLIPATVAMVVGLARFFPEFPGEIIAGILGLVGTFLGALIGSSSAEYWEEKQ